jgi:hypothetical protein
VARQEVQHCNVCGKLDSSEDQEDRVIWEIERALHDLRAEHYLCTFGDDPAGDLAMKFENGPDLQTITVEAHAWPEAIYDRIVQELSI